MPECKVRREARKMSLSGSKVSKMEQLLHAIAVDTTLRELLFGDKYFLCCDCGTCVSSWFDEGWVCPSNMLRV